MRTLTFGDRTISYDVGLDTFAVTEAVETQERKVSVAGSDSADSGVGDTGDTVGDHEEELENGERRVIRPDDSAVRQLLNFDEVTND